jgi:hypothetical protein
MFGMSQGIKRRKTEELIQAASVFRVPWHRGGLREQTAPMRSIKFCREAPMGAIDPVITESLW